MPSQRFPFLPGIHRPGLRRRFRLEEVALGVVAPSQRLAIHGLRVFLDPADAAPELTRGANALRLRVDRKSVGPLPALRLPALLHAILVGRTSAQADQNTRSQHGAPGLQKAATRFVFHLALLG